VTTIPALGEERSPKAAIDGFISLFNNQQIASLDDAASSPWFTIVDGATSVFQSYSEMIDFEGLEATGWSYSRTRDVDVIFDDGNTAFVSAFLERLDRSDKVIFDGQIIFVLVRKKEDWKLAGWISSGNSDIPLGK
tara:strand:+ start:1742 stop:2149 length:408 start_codon:yes stop_codon:yes gene_type:complete